MGKVSKKYHSTGNKFERFSVFFVFYSSNSNRILSSREFIILSDFEFLVCLGLLCCVLWPVFTRGQTHSTDTAQHRDIQHSQIIVLFFNVVVSLMVHDHTYVYFP